MISQNPREMEMQALRQRLEQCVSQFDVFRLLREITGLFGFKFFLVANTSGVASGSFSESVIITSAPAELIQEYESAALSAPDPLATIIRRTGAPFERRLANIEVEAVARDQQSPEIVRNREHGIESCFVVPVYVAEHGAASLCFLGARPELSLSETAELSLYGHLMYEKLRQVSATPAKLASPLTDRERECLLWTAAGKTSIEIGRILDLSEHTVNHYLNNVARKVGAVNRTQAVAYAMRQGYIN